MPSFARIDNSYLIAGFTRTFGLIYHYHYNTHQYNKGILILGFVSAILTFQEIQKCMQHPQENLFCFFKLCLHWAGPRPHIPFPPELILYVNLVAMGPVHLSPVTWPQALRY
jgi:hypothetical protein